MLRNHINNAWLVSFLYCLGVVVTGLTIERSIYSLPIATALCLGLSSYAVLASSSRIGAAKLLLFNLAILVLVFVTLRVWLARGFRHFNLYSPWPHRAYRVWWVSECSVVILALIAAGLIAIEAAGYIGGNRTRTRFQWCVTAVAPILVVVNIANLLRFVSCADCFFPYGLPFTFYTEGGYGGGAGFVWYGLVGDAGVIFAFASICTLLWNRIAP